VSRDRARKRYQSHLADHAIIVDDACAASDRPATICQPARSDQLIGRRT
jgi:hypothetical protein